MIKATKLTNDLLDQWATNSTGPVALSMRQRLLSVEGEDGEDQIIYPPTYADVGYNIDTLADGTKVALIDSVGSQANRLEPAFKSDSGHPLSGFVPQIDIVLRKEACGKCGPCEKAKTPKADKCESPWKEKRSLFDLAHRAADAVVQSSPTLLRKVQRAFEELRKTGDAMPLVTIAPTSLVFGCWDSRGGTGEKRPRLVRSIIRAWDVDMLKSASQFNSVWKALDEDQREALKKGLPKGKKLSEKGFNDAPAQGLGGIVVRGAIERHVTINLVALRGIVGSSEDETTVLRKYLLALSLLTATTDIDMFLREGCNLRIADAVDDWKIVPRRGDKQSIDLSSEDAHKLIQRYAKSAYAPIQKAWKAMKLESEHDFDLQAAKGTSRQDNGRRNGVAMNEALTISVRLHEGWYHGSGSIPSPARVFQALVAGRGLSGPLPEETIDALKWLEKQQPPIVAAPITRRGQAVSTFVPNNDLDAKGGDHRRVGEIRTKKSIHPLLFDDEVPFLFCWQLKEDDDDRTNAKRVSELADGLYQFGRAVDAAWAWADVISADELDEKLRSHRGPVYHPSSGRGNVGCPTNGSVDSLLRRHTDMSNRYALTSDGKGQTFRRRAKPKWRMVSYEGTQTRVSFDLIDRATATIANWPTTSVLALVKVVRDAAVDRLVAAMPKHQLEIKQTLIGRTAQR